MLSRILKIALCCFLVIFSGCDSNRQNFDIKSFVDIPGITDDEIAAIKKLKTSRQNFTLGATLSSETYMQPGGSYSGFSFLLTEYLSGLFDMPFTTKVFHWDDALHRFENYDIDFMIELTPTAERKQKYFMTSPIAERALLVFVNDDNHEIKTADGLNNLKVGFFNGTITEQSVKKSYPELVFQTVMIDDVPQSAQMLQAREIDAVIVDGPVDYEFSLYGNIIGLNILPLVYTPISFSSANPELEVVIKAFDKFIISGGLETIHRFYTRGENEYAKFMFEWSLTNEEKEYIAGLKEKGKKVPITTEPDNYPLCFYDKKVRDFHGIAIDIINEVSRLTGIEFETITNKNTTVAEILEIVQSGKAAFDAELIYTEARAKQFLFSRAPYYISNFALLSKMEYPDLKIYQVPGARVGAVKGTAPAEMYELLIPGSSGYIEFHTRNEALDALEKGKIDLFLTTDYMLLYQTHFREKTGFKINILINTIKEKSFFGFNKNEEILCAIIEKAVNRINVEKIVAQWTNRVYDYTKKIATNTLLYMSISTAILASLLIILIRLLLKNRKMIAKINRQNTLLNSNNKFSSILLEPEHIQDHHSGDFSQFEETIHEAMGVMAEAVGVDRICIWINSHDKDRVHFVLFFELERGIFRTQPRNGTLAPDTYFDEHPAWGETFTRGNCLNALVRDMPPVDRDALEQRNIKSLLVVPVFIQNNLYGYVGFDHCSKERIFSDSEILILRSGSRMLLNAVIRNEMTSQLKIAKEQAEQSNRSKSIFLSHMSHEIRTPMNAILGIAEIQLQNEMLAPEVTESFEKIYESGDLLLNIINDILDLSKIESGKLELIPVIYDIPSLINDTVQLNHLRYESKPIEFILRMEKNTPYELIGDVLRIKQILNNILSNAFKYTEKGKIEFIITVEEGNAELKQRSDDTLLIFKVKDTGQGMTKEQLTRVFDEYTRFNLETNRTTVGAGLGMSITKRLIDLMKGSIDIESTPGVGSVFTVSIPQKKHGTDVCSDELINRLKNFSFHNTTILKKVQFIREYMPYGSVLVVDDVESNIYVARGMMLPYGLKVDTATSGYIALEKIKNGNEYDIIFMDHMMPKMDGIETVRLIREMGYTLPIVALTANALIGRAKMFLQSGFNAFLSKPIDSRELNFVLLEFIKNKKPPEVVEAARKVPVSERSILQRQLWGSEETRAFKIMDFFVRDAENAIRVMEKVNIDDEGIEQYITAVHGIKSALANIGEKDLSEIAFKIEQNARQHDYRLLKSATPTFINALKSLVENFKYMEHSDDFAESGELTDENKSLLHKKLIEIKTACAGFDKRTAKAALEILEKIIWPEKIAQALNDITVCLLHSEFSEIDEIVDAIVNN